MNVGNRLRVRGITEFSSISEKYKSLRLSLEFNSTQFVRILYFIISSY